MSTQVKADKNSPGTAGQGAEPAVITYGIGGESFVYVPKPIERPAGAKKKRAAVPGSKAVWQTGLKYVFYLGLMSVLWLARVGGLSPFSSGVFYALVFLGENPFLLTPLFILSAVVTQSFGAAFYGALCCGGVVLIVGAVSKLRRKPLSLPVMLVSSVAGQAGYMLFAFMAGAEVLYVFLNLVFSLLLAYVAACAFRPVFKYRLKYRLSDIERACVGIVVTVISVGLAALNIGEFRFLYLFALLAIGFSATLLGRGAGVVAGLCVGAGSAFFSYDVTDLALLGLVALVLVIFTDAPRILSALAAVFALVLFRLYFNVESAALWYDLLSLGIGAILYVLFPKRAVERIKSDFFMPHNKLAARYLVNRNRQEISEEIGGVAAVLEEMGALLTPADRTAEDLAAAVSEETVTALCLPCPRLETCKKAGLSGAVTELCLSTEKNGRAFVTDLPKLIDLGCTQIARMIAHTNEALTRRRVAFKRRDDNDRLKSELALQLTAVGGILSDAAARAARPAEYEPELEKIIAEELAAHDIICSEVLLVRGQNVAVTLVVRTETADETRAHAVLERILKAPLSLPEAAESPVKGYRILTFNKKPAYDALFGMASSAKEKEATGDMHTFLRIGSHRFLMALSDGMGSGLSARRVSESAISLIESFYRAGFSSELTLESVNRFMMYAEGDAFSAIDILVVDLETLRADIIKIGTPPSLIKTSTGVAVLEGSSLPLGMVGEMSPSVSSRTLSPGDSVVFVSDGVSDRFEQGALTGFINNDDTLNPKALADKILAAAASNGGLVDDMTVLVCRVFD